MPERDPRRLICPALAEEPGRLWLEEDECLAESARQGRLQIQAGWAKVVPGLMEDYSTALARRWREVARLETLQKEVALLKDRCAELERLAPILVPIETFAPEPYEVVKPFHVVVRSQDDEYMASFFDANLSASGETREEAIANLKDIIAGTFEILAGVEEDGLGPGPLQQRKVLEQFIRKER
jgi:predicted RNase H-like HicB family nuclease